MAKSPTLKQQLNEALTEQMKLQKQLIEAQQENIELRKKLDARTPPVPDDDVNWNKVSNGMTSDEVLANGNFEQMIKFQEWIFSFGEKYIKPYVHHKAYAEMMGHMTRGVAGKLALEEVKLEFGDALPEGKTLKFVDIQRESEQKPEKFLEDTPEKVEESVPIQKPLLED